MTTRYISENAYPETIECLRAAGERAQLIPAADPAQSQQQTAPAVSDHADLYHCRLGIADDAPVIHAQSGELAPGYPAEAVFNAVCTGKFFLHNLNITHPRLLAAAKARGLQLIHVRQGYTRCSTIPVTENAVITYDRGIAGPAETAGLEVLLIEPGYVLLPGYDTGFIGGTCGNIPSSEPVLLPDRDTARAGRTCGNIHSSEQILLPDLDTARSGGIFGAVGQNDITQKEVSDTPAGSLNCRSDHRTLLFNGDLLQHPDGRRIIEFAAARNVDCKWIPGRPLRDIGSIV